MEYISLSSAYLLAVFPFIRTNLTCYECAYVHSQNFNDSKNATKIFIKIALKNNSGCNLFDKNLGDKLK